MLLWCSKYSMGFLSWAPMMLKDVSFSDGCTLDLSRHSLRAQKFKLLNLRAKIVGLNYMVYIHQQQYFFLSLHFFFQTLCFITYLSYSSHQKFISNHVWLCLYHQNQSVTFCTFLISWCQSVLLFSIIFRWVLFFCVIMLFILCSSTNYNLVDALVNNIKSYQHVTWMLW